MSETMMTALYRDGMLEIHAQSHNAATDTLCGCDSNDPHQQVRTRPTALPRGAKIDCEQCRLIIWHCKKYNKTQFRGQS